MKIEGDCHAIDKKSIKWQVLYVSASNLMYLLVIVHALLYLLSFSSAFKKAERQSH